MTTHRRLGVESAKNRALLVEATEQLLREEGYAAVTARKVAARAGLKVQLVHYYFRAMDDLILAVVRKNTERRIERFEQALASPEPFRALWALNTDPAGGVPEAEWVALANHRESIRTEIVAAAKRFRALQIEAVGRLLAQKGVDPDSCPAAGLVVIATALARAFVSDCALGASDGYDAAIRLVERGLVYLDREGAAAAAPRARWFQAESPES